MNIPRTPLHGRDHRPVGWHGTADPGGADPATWAADAWRYDVDNEGGYGYVDTGGTIDVDTLPDPLAVGGEVGLYMADSSGEGAVFGSTGPVVIKSQGDGVSVQAATSPLTVVVNGEAFEFRDDGTIVLPSGAVIGP